MYVVAFVTIFDKPAINKCVYIPNCIASLYMDKASNLPKYFAYGENTASSTCVCVCGRIAYAP